MSDLILRPDLKTAGGEVSDILLGERFVGTLLLVHRELDRICGSVQLEKESLSPTEKKRVIRFVTNYVQSLIHALKVEQCDVLVTYSPFDHVIATEDVHRDLDDLATGEQHIEPEVIWVHDDDSVGDWDVYDQGSIHMAQDRSREGGRAGEIGGDVPEPLGQAYYELVSTKESPGKLEYHVYGDDREWIAEVFLRVVGPDVFGDIHWMHNPSEDEIEHVTDLIVSDFNPDEIDTFTFDHRHEGKIVETVELTHEDLLDADNRAPVRGIADELEEYTVVLARDDGDMLTYEIYRQNEGGLPIGTATVDISRKQLSGFIDFRMAVERPGDRENIATLIMRELDKEKDYDTISFTMLHQNKPIDEIVFENETVH